MLVQGNAATFDWSGLARRVQGLVAPAERPALDPPAVGPSAAEAAEHFRAYQRHAVPALAALHESPQARGLLAYALLMPLAHGHAPAARLDDALRRARQPSGHDACPLGLAPFGPSLGPAEEIIDTREEGRGGPDAVPPLP